MLTNFATIRKAIRKMTQIDKMEADGTLNTMSKRERLQVSRQRRQVGKEPRFDLRHEPHPCCRFHCGRMKEHIALAEAKKVGHPCHCHGGHQQDPRPVDFPHSSQ